MHIITNKNRLGKHIEIIENVAAEGVIEKGFSREAMNDYKRHAIEEEGVLLERTTVEEMAHAFYILDMEHKPGGLKAFFEEWNKYQQPLVDQPNPTEEEWHAYINSPIEQDGAKWKAAFMRRYYSNADTTR